MEVTEETLLLEVLCRFVTCEATRTGPTTPTMTSTA
jgi:hypothetical protein